VREPIHVLYLIDTYHGKSAGGEATLRKISRLLPHDRYSCSVATFASDLDVRTVRALLECPVYLLPLRNTYNWSALQVARRIRGLIRDQRVQIVHTFFTTSDLWGGLIARLSGVPILVSSRRDMGILRTNKHRLAYRLCAGMYDQVHAVCEEVREASIRQDGLDPSRVVTVHNGVDLDEIHAAPALDRTTLAELAGASHLIVSVGNVRRVKGMDVLIRAASGVCRKFPRAVFLIIGYISDPPYLEELKALSQSLGLQQNIRFLGLRHDVVSLLKRCDLFCLLSRSEGHSNALLEAMACGLPCVVTRVGGNAEVAIEGETGFLVPSEEPDLASERIIWLLDHPEMSKKMGERGRQIVEEKFTVQRMVEQIMRLYDGLIEKKLHTA
jgi:L-malate glycosyltransferase